MLHCIHFVYSEIQHLSFINSINYSPTCCMTQTFFTVQTLSGIMHIFHARPHYFYKKRYPKKLTTNKKKRSNVHINYSFPKYQSRTRSSLFCSLTFLCHNLRLYNKRLNMIRDTVFSYCSTMISPFTLHPGAEDY